MNAKVLFLSLIVLMSLVITPSFWPGASAHNELKAVFCEEGTATWCVGCPNTAEALHEIYNSDSSFYYVAMVTDKNDKAAGRLEEYNPVGYPTSFFDGGYSVVFGGKSGTEPYQSAIDECRSRESPNVDISVDVSWLGDATIDISITIHGNSYQGHLRAYVVEPRSRWNDHDGNPYHFGFLDFAVDKDVDVEGTLSEQTTWNGSDAGYGDITRDNIMVIAVLFDSEGHTSYSDPPSNSHPFTAHYVDAVAAASPPKDSPPSVKITEKPPSLTGIDNVTFSWEGSDDFTPAGDILYSYMLSGYDTWSQWTHDTGKSYELADGTYTFMVKCRDNAGQEGTASYKFTVDTSPPSVVSTDPADNSKDNDAFTPVTITFSFNMNKSSVYGAISISPAADYELRWNSDNVLAISPRDHWEYDKVYTITVSGSIRRESGQEMGSPYTFSFEISSADNEPPEVISSEPHNGGKVTSRSNITIQFSEPMDKKFMGNAIKVEPWFSYHIVWEDNSTMLIVPKFLPPGEYSITITTYAMDRAGNHLTGNYTVNFEVGRPEVVSSSPYDGEIEVPVSSEIYITFSEEMNESSVINSIDSTFDFTASWNGNVLVLTPSAPLEYGKQYSVKIENATNVYGIRMDSGYAFSFVTEEEIPERAGEETPSFTFVIFLFAAAFSLAIYRKSH